MSRLGDFLEVVYGPRVGFQTVRAVIRNWRNQSILSRALSKSVTLGRRMPSAEPEEPPHIVTGTTRVWWTRTDKARIDEETIHWDGRKFPRLTIQNGKQWWERDPEGHVEVGDVSGTRDDHPVNLTDSDRHFNDAQLREFFQSLALSFHGSVMCAGRDCIRIRAVMRPNANFWPHWISSEADEYEFHADPERGVVLTILAFCEGELCESFTVEEVAFDEPLDDGLFTYELRSGEQMRKPESLFKRLTLPAVVAQATFTVLVPTDPECVATPHEVTWYSSSHGGDMRPHLDLWYAGDARLTIQEGDEHRRWEDLEWEAVTWKGREMAISDPGEEGQRLVRLVHLGTHVEITSDLPRERLFDIAASLEPAKGS